VAEWRGLPQRTQRTAPAGAISETLALVMKRLGLNERLTESQVVGAWKDVVGEFIASHSCPSRIRDGVLYVQVVQPTVHFELDRHWKPEILKKLRQRFGSKAIRDVRFRVG
jgi:predicted nucleic acid-binding Zn ribbon protein